MGPLPLRPCLLPKCLLLALSLLPFSSIAQTETTQDLKKLKFEDLMTVEVTTASKSAQSISKVPSAIFVIQSEDIRRSGATCLPEALRLAPGLNVQQIDANKWMISIRGFNNRFANKLLVLVDGQSVYTPLFSGVYWDAHMLPLSEVDRIEIIRGPGGSLWGANAVNGVVNIITKAASQTQGGHLKSEVGSDFNQVGAQFGGKYAENGHYRVYADVFDQTPLTAQNGGHGPDGFRTLAAGFKFEQGGEKGDRYLFKTDFQSERLGQRLPVPTLTPPYLDQVDSRFSVSSFDSIVRWERTEDSGRSQSLQLSFEHYDRSQAADASEKRSTLDLDYQTQLAPAGKHSLTLGAGYRYTTDKTQGSGFVRFDPVDYTEKSYSLFLHDSIMLAPKWKLLAGSKFVNNPYTNWEIQPNAQILYTPDEHSTYWYSLSRAVRTPSRADRNVSFNTSVVPGPPPTQIRILGNPDFISETVVANEVGARFKLKDGSFLDLTAFLDHYENLRTLEPGQPYLENGFPVQPLQFGNKMAGDTAGIEVAVKKQIRPGWTLAGSYSLFSERLWLQDSNDTLGVYKDDGRGGAPRHQFQLHSYADLRGNFEFDTDLYYVSPLISGAVDAYFKLDCRLGWSPSKDVSLSLGVRNALSPNTIQAGESTFESIGMVPRSIYLRLDWKF